MIHSQSDRQKNATQATQPVLEMPVKAVLRGMGILPMRLSNEDKQDGPSSLPRCPRIARSGLVVAFALVLALLAPARQLPAASAFPDFQIPVEMRPKFSQAPADSELMGVRLFGEPLAPMEAAAVAGENAALGRAVEAFAARTKQGDVSALAAFVAAFPKSRWAAAVYLNMGILQFKNGEFSQVLNDFDRAWELSKTAKTRPATFIRDRAAAEGGRMNARLGNLAWLDQFLSETGKIEISGTAGEVLRHTREGVSLMHTEPEKSFMCGPNALLSILPSDVPPAVREEIRQPQSTAQGTSLALILGLSKKTGKNYQTAFRSPGAKLIVPAVIHWSVGHFAALVAERDNAFLCKDPIFGEDILIGTPALDQEASGYFLIPEGPLPPGWRPVPASEAATIWGKGNPSGKEDDECRKCSKAVQSCCGSPGMAAYNVHAMLVSLTVFDTPVGYTPANGPAVAFTATYNQRDVAQPSDNKLYSNLGPQWCHNWLSFVQVDGVSARLVEEGGGYVTFSGFNSTTGLFDFNMRSSSTLALVSDGTFVRTFSDGSCHVYAKPDGTGRYFLTQVVDARGNAVTISYDSNFRISTITDASGLVTTIGYSSAIDYKIETVTDPFGRSARFDYDGSGRLIKITDVVGITSQFSYDGAGSFINVLETPYGKTTFSFGENGINNWLEARDPEGNVERTEFVSMTSAISYGSSDPVNSIPAGCDAGYLQFRNTVFWSKKAYAEGQGDYTKGHIFHWLHRNTDHFASGVLESEKNPFENRICYLYQGQTENIWENDTMFTALPAKILQKIDAGTGPASTQVTSYVFNPLGLPTTSIDPAGRETRCTYAANNIDLLTVERKNGSDYDLLSAFTYNDKHQRLTSTDASGQTSTMAYNAHGQLLTLTNALNKTTTFTYDSLGRLISVDGPLAGNGDIVFFTYDPVVTTRVKSVTTPDGTKTYSFDNLDRVTKVAYADGTYEEATYKFLDPEWLRDRLGRWTRLSYNALRQKIAVLDPALRLTQYTWCKCGDLKSIVDGNGNYTMWRHDVAGRIWEKEYADGSKEEYYYDQIGRLASVVDTAGITRFYAYSVDNNLLSIASYAGGSATTSTSFTYDAAYKRMATMADPSGNTAFTYNPVAAGTLGAGSLASVSGPLPNAAITYGYDALGRVKQRAINGVARDFVFVLRT